MNPMRGEDPFEEIEDLIDRMSREFEGDAFGLSSGVAVDVADRGDEFVVTAELPGYDKDEIDVTLIETTLRIEADRETDLDEEEPGEYVRRERRRESVSRSVRLPEAVDEDAVEATYADGVLQVHLPKREADGGRRIEIE